ncbi:alpha/beta hydrolase family protein [Ideonella sp. BN130291]|uniref:alpha/beta hydrolase family protein n=1 Tax=Ideonella sp. BN130291 TaxID=3112940 RepID=UPI002E257DC1|nr:prolyl oligopeptidase family serine peptidase [Ideonella sp. BN130291]
MTHSKRRYSVPARAAALLGGMLLSWGVVRASDAAPAPAPGASAPLPAEAFVRPPAMRNVALSPDGRRLAMLVATPTGYVGAAVMDLDPIGKVRWVASFVDADVERLQWVNNDRLVFFAAQRSFVVQHGGAGLFAVDHDGSRQRRLISWIHHNEETGSNIQSRVLPYGWNLETTLDDGSADVIVNRRIVDGRDEVQGFTLARLNTLDGIRHNMSIGQPARTFGWLLDKTLTPRVATSHTKGRTQVWWRAEGASAEWSSLAEFDDFTPSDAFSPWQIDADGQLLVTAYGSGDTEALYRFDTAARRLLPEPLVQVKGFDLDPVAETDRQTNQLVGVHFMADRPYSYWFNAELGRAQRGLDAALPGRTNRIYCGRCESTRFLVVRSSSDRLPGEYYLLDRQTSAMQPLGKERPWIDEATQGRRSFHRVAARDGLQLPVYVTHPAGSKADQPLPTVLLVHGGPWVRGSSTEWDAEAQFLASRGYRVLQPEFRGSTGYGAKLFRAGWKQWGQAMDEDLVDTVQWAVKQKLVDGSRVCIMGASYGGYAALMGVIKSPQLYRCAISFAGVTDLRLMRDVAWSDMSEEYKRYGMPVLVGDPDRDKDLYDRYSPLQRAGDIKVPVLVVHGGEDRRVPVVHTREFVSAAQRAGVSVQKLIYTEEGHGFYDLANRADYLRRVEAFLKESMAGSR